MGKDKHTFKQLSTNKQTFRGEKKMKKQKIRNRNGYYGEPIFNIAFNKANNNYAMNKRISKRAKASMDLILNYLDNLPKKTK